MIAQRALPGNFTESPPGALRHAMLFSVGMSDDILVIRDAGLKPIGAQ
jgi:hypothetical protein